MISEMAKADIQQLIDDGLNPTIEDIIKLNTLALRFQESKSKNIGNNLYSLPRVAIVSDDLYFQQPTIAHEIWLQKVKDIINDTDYDTILLVYAYALSNKPENLINPYCKNELIVEIEKLKIKLAPYTEEQIYIALDYVQNGINQTRDEFVVTEKKENIIDVYDCVAVGQMLQGKVILSGMTLKEIQSLTTRQLNEMICLAYYNQGINIKNDGTKELGDYYKTLDKIRERLTQNKD